MQVTHINPDTHSILGGGRRRKARAAETAEFFTVLSDTLYTNKIRAVVREVIANAVDANVMAGRPDAPVEITLDPDAGFMVKDCGPGIPHDTIEDVYFVWGGSTKTKQDNQIGGFGLGAKAPFAVSDTFTVENSHGGQRTVYAITRSSDEDNEPSMIDMVTIPDAETGVTVTVPIETGDYSKFRTEIQHVVFTGGINATLNGSKVECRDYRFGRQVGFSIFGGLPEHAISVLIGSVTYPVPNDPAYKSDYEAIISAFKTDYYSSVNAAVVLIAKPNTVFMVPSREALSMTPKTIEGLKGLLRNARRQIQAEKARAVKARARQKAQKILGLEVTEDKSVPSFPMVVADGFVSDHAVKAWMRRLVPGVARYMQPGRHSSAVAAHYEARIYTRLAAKANVAPFLMFERGAQLFRAKFFDHSLPPREILVVGPNQRDTLEAIREKNLSGTVPCLIIQRMTEQQQAAITAAAARYNLDVEFVERTAAPKKAKVVEKTFPTVMSRYEGLNGEGKRIVTRPETEIPISQVTTYLNVMGGRPRFYFKGKSETLLDIAQQIKPDTVFGLGELDKFHKVGAIDFEEWLAGELKKHAGTPGFEFGRQIGFTGDGSDAFFRLIHLSIKHEPKFDTARLLVPGAIKRVTPKIAEQIKFGVIAGRAEGRNAHHSILRRERNQADFRFPLIDLLSASSIKHLDAQQLANLVTAIRASENKNIAKDMA